jgi:serine/threonine-protein kinase
MAEKLKPSEERVLLDRYTLVSRLGHGGMSVVYLGEDQVLKRPVAVKVMLPALADNRNARIRFQREAKSVASLRHPNVLQIFDYATPDETEPFIIMEYVDGLTLRRFIEQHGPLVPEAAARIVSEVSRGLSAAHESNIIHRDLKPENVMIGRDGRVLLMDFGIAHVMGVTKLTMTGALVGSPAHMAPEIIEGSEIGPSSDIWALGTVLYTVLANGELPFVGRTPHEVMKKILDGEFADVRTVSPMVGNALTEIIIKCMDRDPANRYSTAQSVADAIDRAIPSEVVPQTRPLVQSIFDDPETSRSEIILKLRESLELELTQVQADGNQTRQLDVINRLLAIDPDHAEARQGLQQLARQSLMRRWLRLIATGLVLTLGLIFGFKNIGGAEDPDPGPVDVEIVELLPSPKALLPNEARYDETADATKARRRGSEDSQQIKGIGRVTRTQPPSRRVRPKSNRPNRLSRAGAGTGTTKPNTDHTTKPLPVVDREPVNLTIFADPPAAKIFLADQFKGFGRVNLSLIPGKHKVTLQHPNCTACATTDYYLNVDAERSAGQEFRYRIKYKAAQLLVRTPTPGRVFLGGSYVGTTGVLIRIDMSGPRQLTREIKVLSGSEVYGPRKIKLEPGIVSNLSF